MYDYNSRITENSRISRAQKLDLAQYIRYNFHKRAHKSFILCNFVHIQLAYSDTFLNFNKNLVEPLRQ